MASRIANYYRSSRGMAMAAAEVKAKTAAKADMVAVYVPLGMVVGALTMAAYTMEGQLAHSPSVRVNKQLRGTVPEVDEADRIAGEGDRYVNRSVFRRVAHVQDFDAVRSGVFDPTRPDNVFRHPRRRSLESLKSVGVDPRAA